MVKNGIEGEDPLGYGAKVKRFDGWGMHVTAPPSLFGLGRTQSYYRFWELVFKADFGLKVYYLGKCGRFRYFWSPYPGDCKSKWELNAKCRDRYGPPPPAEPPPPPYRKPRMVKFESPFKLPRFTDDEFEQKKREYVAKYGYTVRAPHFSDIIHLPVAPEITKEDREEFVRALKEGRDPDLPFLKKDYLMARREKYKRMLESPSPKWLRNIGAILTAIDDAEDALSTLCVIGRLAIRLAPRLLGRFIPILGWGLVAADALSLLNFTSLLPVVGRAKKRRGWDFFGDNPFNRTSRIKRAMKAVKKLPGIGDLLEVAQTTDNIFGIGISLGPIVGYAQDIITGAVRTIKGEKVSWKHALPKPYLHEEIALRAQKAATVAAQVNPWIDDEDRQRIIIAWFFSNQVLSGYYGNLSPWDPIEPLHELEFQAPRPYNPDTIYILEEYGYDPFETATWPATETEWERGDVIIMSSIPEAITVVRDYLVKHYYDLEGYCLSQIVHQSGMLNNEILNRDDEVLIGLTNAAHHVMRILNAGLNLKPGQDPKVLQAWWDEALRIADDRDAALTYKELRRLGREYGVKIRPEAPTEITPELAELIPDWEETVEALRNAGYHI